MASAPDNQVFPGRDARVRAHLERLANDVARIEFSYPAANLGLAAVCRDALALVGSASLEDASIEAPITQPDGDHEMALLEAQKELGLVPRHEYRRRRRELIRALRHSRLAGAPVLQRVAGAGAVLLDGLNERLDLLGEFTERFHGRRLAAHLGEKR